MNFELNGRAWAFFVLWTAANTILAYLPVSLELKLWTALGGVCLSALLVLTPARAQTRSSAAPAAIPAPLWVGFLALLLAVHFFRPGSFPSWPIADDGYYAFFSLDLAHHWNWRMLWGRAQTHPLGFWLFGLLFKWFPLNAVTMRMIPSLLSLGMVAAAYRAARCRFSPTFSFYFAWFLGLGFWPLSFSRMLQSPSLYLILELWALSALLRITEPGNSKIKIGPFLELGAAVGLAYDTWLSGAALATVATLTLLAYVFFRTKGWGHFFSYLGLSALLAAPVVGTQLGGGGMSYLLTQRGSGLNWNYFPVLFWDGFNSMPYGPSWGGLFNPVAASLAFLGTAALFEKRRRLTAGWVVFALFFFLAPGLFSNGMEMFRILNLLPLVAGLSAWGLEKLSVETGKAWRMAAVLPLALSAGLDLYHYLGPYQQFPPSSRILRNDAFASMDGVLEDSRRRGNQIGLLDFTVNDYDDHTFDVLTRPLNAFAGPGGAGAQVDQLALVADVHYRPFLEKRFPGGQWFSFPEDFSPGDPGWVLGMIPAGEMGKDKTLLWAQAAQAFSRVRSQRMYWQIHQPFDPIIRDFLSQEGSFKGDPFLESVFWEEGALLFNIQRNLPLALACYQKALEKGYPAAQIYNEMGTLEALKGLRDQARLDFEKALAAPLNRTTAESNLQALKEPN